MIRTYSAISGMNIRIRRAVHMIHPIGHENTLRCLSPLYLVYETDK
jgi:hypothetical protein